MTLPPNARPALISLMRGERWRVFPAVILGIGIC